MTNQVITQKQYDLLAQLHNVIESLNQEDDTFKELVDDADIFGGKLDDIQGDIERRIEIIEFIKRYEVGELNNTATISITNSIGVMIVEAESDYVFGYVLLSEDEKQFFLSEVRYKQRETSDDDYYPIFNIGENGLELNLGEAMRI
jgi:flagellar motor protein MotB